MGCQRPKCKTSCLRSKLKFIASGSLDDLKWKFFCEMSIIFTPRQIFIKQLCGLFWWSDFRKLNSHKLFDIRVLLFNLSTWLLIKLTARECLLFRKYFYVRSSVLLETFSLFSADVDFVCTKVGLKFPFQKRPLTATKSCVVST